MLLRDKLRQDCNRKEADLVSLRSEYIGASSSLPVLPKRCSGDIGLHSLPVS